MPANRFALPHVLIGKFFVRGGVGYLWSRLPAEDLARVENLSPLVDSDGSVEVLMPSLKLGFIGFL